MDKSSRINLKNEPENLIELENLSLKNRDKNLEEIEEEEKEIKDNIIDVQKNETKKTIHALTHRTAAVHTAAASRAGGGRAESHRHRQCAERRPLPPGRHQNRRTRAGRVGAHQQLCRRARAEQERGRRGEGGVPSLPTPRFRERLQGLGAGQHLRQDAH